MNVRERFDAIRARIVLPAIAAPMFLVSGPELVIACCQAGMPASFPTLNARPESELVRWLDTISASLRASPDSAPWIPNLVLHPSNPRHEADVDLVLDYEPEIVITALGKPAKVAARAHVYGGLVFSDVNSVKYARIAADNGADGLILLCAGAGGHTGMLSPFAFVDAVRSFFDGPLVVAGGIASGGAICGVEAMGADLAYIGTRFIATRESMASPAYRDMLIAADETDIVISDKFTGVPANYLQPSIAAAGIDLDAMQKRQGISIDQRDDAKAWRDIWSAGHGVRSTVQVETVADLVERLTREYRDARVRSASASA